MPAAQDEDLPRMLGSRYRLEATIGHGGMGVVYRGIDLTMQRPIAVKLIRTVEGVELDDEVAGRFLREAKNTARLQHEHIIDVFDLGRDPTGMYFVMELLSGESLSARIRREGKLAPERVVHIGRQMCDALEVAHRAGIIHRDLKPANIMLLSRAGDADFVKVLDFGVAKSYAGDDQTQLTHTGMLVGTVDYMAPEQIMGKEVDGRTDVYSLGVMLYKMLSGKAPFRDTGVPALIHAHLNTIPKPLMEVVENIPNELGHVVLRCLMKNPDRRYESMAELGRALTTAIQGTSMDDAMVKTAQRIIDLEYRPPGGDIYDETTTGARGGNAGGSGASRRDPQLGFDDDEPLPEDATISDDPTIQFDRSRPVRRLTAEELGLPPTTGLRAHEGNRPLPLPPKRNVVPAGAPSPFGPPVLYPEDLSTQKRSIPAEITRIDREARICAMCGVKNAPHALVCAACGVSLGTDEQAAMRQRPPTSPPQQRPIPRSPQNQVTGPHRPITMPPPTQHSVTGPPPRPITMPPTSGSVSGFPPSIPPPPLPPTPSSSRRNLSSTQPPSSTPRSTRPPGSMPPPPGQPGSNPSRPVYQQQYQPPPYTDPARQPYGQQGPSNWPSQPPPPHPSQAPSPDADSTWQRFLRWTGIKNR